MELPRRPKAVLICYGCEPGQGSEAGAGWTWAKAASEVADVTLITCRDDDRVRKIKETIEEAELPITLVAIGGASSVRRIRDDGLIARLSYCVWQMRAARAVRQQELREHVDVVHHVTFASDSLPSALMGSKAPIRVWGPVGGTTRTAFGLYRYMTPRGVVEAVLRDVTNGIFRAVFATRVARHSTLVVALNQDVERRWRRGSTPVVVESNTGIDPLDLMDSEGFVPGPELGPPGRSPLRVALFVGRLIPWKGLLLAVESLQHAPGWKLVVLGEGPDRARAEALAMRTGVGDRVDFRGRIPRTEVLGALRSADALLFPSFHDSAPWAVGEATSLGCPVVCLDAGGPAMQAGTNAQVVPVAPASTLAQRIGLRLEGLTARRAPDDHLLLDRLPSVLKSWYSASDEKMGQVTNGAATYQHAKQGLWKMQLTGGQRREVPGGAGQGATPLLMIATILREEGVTGVHTHVRELRRYLDGHGMSTPLITPFSWGGALSVPIFGVRPVLERFDRASGVLWYRHWHSLFLRNALRQELAEAGDGVIYAQGPEAAIACLDARTGPGQQVVMAVHYPSSQAEGWVEKGRINRGGRVYKSIQRMEKEVIPQVDGLVYVSRWARDELLAWLPEVGRIRSAIIPNFIEPIDAPTTPGSMGDLVTVGSLENTKNNNFLLEVLAEAKRAGRSLRLDIFGSGALRKDLQRSAESLGIIDQVTFRGYQPDVRQFLRGYRVYVHACPSETGPLAIIEAMAEGLPIVAPKSGGSPELYRDGVEGRFWSLADPAQAAATLIELLDCEAERLEFAAAAVTRFRDNFSAELVGPRLLSFLLGEATSPAEDEPSKVDPAFAR